MRSYLSDYIYDRLNNGEIDKKEAEKIIDYRYNKKIKVESQTELSNILNNKEEVSK